jgi:hypothetical protein
MGLVLKPGGQVRAAVGSSILLRTDDGLVRLAPMTVLAVNAKSGARHLAVSEGRIFVACKAPGVT